MKKLRLLALFLAFAAAAAMQISPCRALAAEEGGGEAKKEAGGEGGEGGGKKDSKKKGEDEEVTGGRFAGDPIYVHIAPLTLPVINDKGVQQIVMIIFDVEVKDFDSAENLRARMPKLRDALMRRLYGGLGTGALRDGKLVNVEKVKAKATDAVSEIIGKDNVRDVLVQGVSQRML